MSSSSERAFVNSRAMRRASVTNNKEDLSLKKENTRLRREFRAQELQLKAAQKRFELRKGKHVYSEEKKRNLNENPKHKNETAKDSKESPPVRKSSVGSLPPIHEHGRSGNAAEPIQVRTSNLTMASLKSHNESDSRNSNRRNSLFPPVRDLCSRGSARSLHTTNTLSSSSNSQLNGDSKSDLGRTRAMSLPVPPRCSAAAVMATREQEAPLGLNQSAENKFGTWPRQKPVDFSSVSLRARIRFLSTLTRFLRTSPEAGDADLESKSSDELQEMYEKLEHCRYLRKPRVREPEDTRTSGEKTD